MAFGALSVLIGYRSISVTPCEHWRSYDSETDGAISKKSLCTFRKLRPMMAGNQPSRGGKAMIQRGAIIGMISLLLSFRVWAHGGHDDGAALIAPLWVWLVGGAILVIIALVLIRQAKKGTLIGERFRGFSRNARLLLIRSPFSGLSVSLLRLLFNLYLIAVGFDLLFVAKFA